MNNLSDGFIKTCLSKFVYACSTLLNQVNLFIGFGVVAMIGLLIMLLFMGPLVKNKELHQYVEGDSTPILQP